MTKALCDDPRVQQSKLRVSLARANPIPFAVFCPLKYRIRVNLAPLCFPCMGWEGVMGLAHGL